ncbi:MAG: hypothetical protein AAFQ66_13500 [Pseudomonadota bacterium]
MSVVEDLANGLALRALAAEQGPDDQIVDTVSKSIGDMSPTLQEAYLTAIRLHRAEKRGQLTIDQHLRALGLGIDAAPRMSRQAPPPPMPQMTTEALAELAEADLEAAPAVAELEVEVEVEDLTDIPEEMDETEPEAETPEMAEEVEEDSPDISSDPVRALMDSRRQEQEAEEAARAAEKAKKEARALRADHLSMIDSLIDDAKDDD